MEPIIVSAAGGLKAPAIQRVDGPSQASRRREVQTERAAVDLQKREPGAGEVNKAAERLNEALQEFHRDLNISIHQDTGQMVVQVKDSSGKVIRQMPPEQLLEAEVNIDKILGLFVNNRV